jgi:hypothetical protein
MPARILRFPPAREIGGDSTALRQRPPASRPDGPGRVLDACLRLAPAKKRRAQR